MLKQRSEIVGQYVVVIDKRGLIAKNVNNHYVVLSKPPDWKVIVFNKKTKVYCVTDKTHFRGEPVAVLYAYDRHEFSKAKWIKVNDSKICGINCTLYRMAENHLTQTVKSALYYASSQVFIPKQAQEILAKIFQLPPVPGLPLRLTYWVTEHRDRVIGMDTNQVSKAFIADKEFTLPPNYKRVSSENEVYKDPAAKPIIDALSNWIQSDGNDATARKESTQLRH